jgi:hypothetical protein
MRSLIAVLHAAGLLALPISAASAATVHLLGVYPDPKLYACDLVTGAVTLGADPDWPTRGGDLALLGGQVFRLSVGEPCDTELMWLARYDVATGQSGAEVALSVAGYGYATRGAGGLASDGARLVASFDDQGSVECPFADALADIGPDGTMTNFRVFPPTSDLRKIVFTPDGRLLAWTKMTSTPSTQYFVYEVHPTAPTMTFLGAHSPTNSGSRYEDLVFTPEGELWGLERDLDSVQRLRRITSSFNVDRVVPLPPTSVTQYTGLVVLPDGTNPAANASWGRVKGAYRR